MSLIVAGALLGGFVMVTPPTWAEPETSATGPLFNRTDWDCYLDGGYLTRGGCLDDPVAWTSAVVPFDFASDVSSGDRRRALEAMDAWVQADAGIVFLPRSHEPDFIHVVNSDFNRSCVGMVGGSQTLEINVWPVQAVIVHELGHALGLWHEQSRPDRSGFVEFNPDNVTPGDEHNFDIEPFWLSLDTSYDLLSIMHYRGCAFSNCSGCPFNIDCEDGGQTLVCLPGFELSQPLMGNVLFMSDTDRQDIRDMYSAGVAKYVDRLSSALIEQGTLADPFREVPPAISTLQAGSTLCIREGTYVFAGEITKPMIIWAYLGSVTLTQ